ncbi:His Kinase A domain containing protein [Entomortierella lignicola]|nr:His Kinase A domain containing protein [Entomortierella lignicola]
MASTLSSTSSSENMSLQDQGERTHSTTPQRERPRFLRAITSPLPLLGAFVAHVTEDSTAQQPTHNNTTDNTSTHSPGSQSDQPLSNSNDISLRSFSSSIISSILPSALGPSLAPPLSPTSPSQRRTSIVDTLRERRWSKGQILNWMPGFTQGQYPDVLEAHPSPIISNESTPRSLKSVQRYKSDSTEFSSLSSSSESSKYSDGCAILGLDTISVSGNMCVSDPLQELASSSTSTMASSKSSNAGLAERLSEFAQGKRSVSSTDSPILPGSDPKHQRPLCDGAIFKNGPKLACLETELAAEFNTWDDFLSSYGQGHFPNVQTQRHPRSRLEPEYPPLPNYARSANHTSMINTLPFLAAPLPPTEENRLKALYSYQILGTGSDENFQRITQLVSTVLGVSGCMVCLVDHRDVAIKAHYRATDMECKREISFSGHAILRPPGDPLIVLDASRDWRFKNLPAVKGGPRVRFYAGASLATSDGHNIGSLCVIDTKPRSEFTDREKAMLVDFASVVMREMELWNDQVQLCTRTRMMRDITRWVRGCLGQEPMPSSIPNTQSDITHKASAPSLNHVSISQIPGSVEPPTFLAPSAVIPGPDSKISTLNSTSPPEPALPTPSGSPTLLSSSVGSRENNKPTVNAENTYHGRLRDEAFPSACSMIQATLNVDAVYLVQISFNKSSLPFSGSGVVWSHLGVEDRAAGFVGSVGGKETSQDLSTWKLSCLATSRKSTDDNGVPLPSVSTQRARREGNSLICTDEGCRPHSLGDLRPDAVDPLWSRDMPLISEVMSYVRQEKSYEPLPGKCPLFTCYENFDGDDLFASSFERQRRSFLCHTFQGTLQELSVGHTSPYKSCVVTPIHGSSPNHAISERGEPWAYFVVLTSSHTKQFSIHERIYLKNFGSCLITEVLKRRVEAADKAKGIFIKSISHELRTPLHIMLGILELLYSNEGDNLSDQQLSMIASAEASGKGLNDIINNIIDLADIDPENDADSDDSHRSQVSLPKLYTQVAEVDIRELCEQVAGAMAKSCIDKNLVIVPSWTKPSLSSLSSSFSTAPTSSYNLPTNTRRWSNSQYRSGLSSNDESSNGYLSSPDSQNGFSGAGAHGDQKIALELLVAMDEPESDPDNETPWNFMLNLPIIKRILTQLLENALKFTTTGFVEISAVSPPLSKFPLKPPSPDSRPILFTVRDTGKGISPEFVQAHLFQRFSQEDPLQVGTGLGLALVKLLVESLGGWLEIWSEGIEGKGCVVRVLIWATPSKNTTKSIKDEKGVWQEKSCRFYTGEPSVSTDRLWTIMGERMMNQDFNMNVQRGDEQDISPEDMLKDLNDKSQCNLLILNDDLTRLKAYLLHYSDQHVAAKSSDVTPSAKPIPLLMLTSISTAKKAHNLLEAYRRTWDENGRPGSLATVVFMQKPTGPLKLMRCLHTCFTEEEEVNGHDASESMRDMGAIQTSPIPLLRSTTSPHITTMALGVHDTRRLSAGTMIKSSFKFPTSPSIIAGLGDTSVPPHSPGGLILPKTSFLPNSSDYISNSPAQIEATIPEAKILFEQSETKPKRSIKNFMSQRGGQSRTTSKSKRSSLASDISVNTAGSQEKDLVQEKTDKIDAPDSVPRVLIVEDNMTNRMILRTFLKKQGISVVEAENGKLGVERFQEEVWRRQGRSGFEFVLMDIQMPVMDGNLATKRIREFEQSIVKQHGLSIPEPSSPEKCSATEEVPESEERGYKPTVIFALTGLASDEDKRLAFECGVDGYLTKPVSLKTLGGLLSNSHSNKTDAAVAD